ncbi:MAG TPA: type VI secretion system membrane subunit TssM [Polyangia bacterium]|jgi:type VI secretion system protein ImpL|nr:type VI secretion system membrane subunit TssM [Polyangia bacterium]
MLKYIFSAIFVALAWALVLVFHDVMPMWPAVVATAVIAAVLVGLLAWRILAARRAAAAIEDGLRDQASRQNDGMRPDLQAEIAAMESEFNKAVGALKGSKLGRNGRDALGLLPWYVMIGPSASGKTTAIRSSGLKLPYGKGGKVRGVGGTRNCDWWMTNEAILLDTAGRWSTDDDDRDEWLAFLDLLKRTRPKKPINGILLAVSATDLQKSAEEIQELSVRLRERIDEVITRLEVIVPVYLMVTKCDLIAGFVEAFGDLKDRERGQIWGFSLPLVSEATDHVDEFAAQFDVLTEVLERQALVRMGEERRIDARERIYSFPQQFDSLRQGLVDLVASLFDQSVYQDAPIMRGVYFTSGTQEGRPVDRIMASMAEAFGVRPRLAAAAPTKPKSYFVKDVFQRVVFPDRDVAVRSARVLKRERLLRWVTAIGALSVSAAVLVLPISSYLANKQFIVDTRGFVEKLVRAREDRPVRGPLDPTALEAALPMATRLAKFAAKGPEVGLQFVGLYPGDRLMDPVHAAVEKLVVRPLLDSDDAQLQAFAKGHGDFDGSGAMSGLLLHLLLTQPKASDEPSPESDGWRDHWVSVLAETASDRFAAITGSAATTKSRQSLEGALRFYALNIEEASDLIDRKPAVVSRTRAALLGANEGDPLADLLRDPNMPRDIRLIDIVGGAVTVFQGGEQHQGGPMVPGAFTPEGWKITKARIERLTADREHDENAWVLGAARKREVIDAGALQMAYFRRYVDSWKAFLLSLSIKEPTNIEDVRRLLKAFMMDKPLDSIWRNASKNLVFKDDSLIGKVTEKASGSIDRLKKKILGSSDADAAASGGKTRNEEPTSPEDVGREFATFLSFGLTKPTGLDTYGQILAELNGAVGDQGAPDPRAFQTTIKAQRVKLQTLINSFNENGWEAALLEKILMPPLLGSEVAVSGATGDSANRKWCDSIVVVYDQLLAGKYPFSNGKGARDARVADVEKFFQPKTGTLWQYFSETLQADVDHPAGTTVFHVKDQPSVKYKPALVAFLKHAQELTDLLYAKDPGKLGLTVSIRIRPSAPYTKIVFDSGGRKVTYFNTKERWDEVVWPARGALFHFFQKSGDGEIGYTDGEWALFHLLEAGKLSTSSDGEEYLAGTWAPPVGDGLIRADIKPAVLLRAFRGFDIPHSIVQGAGGCGR